MTNLPKAVFVKDLDDFVIYRGTPDEMVASMAKAIGAPSNRLAIAQMLIVLARRQHVFIDLPADADDTELSTLFMTALLDLGFVRPMAQA